MGKWKNGNRERKEGVEEGWRERRGRMVKWE